MNKQTLVDQVASKAGVMKKDAEKCVNALFDSIESALASGDKVQILGFGTFEPRERSARSGRNPQTGETITISAKKVAGFKASSALNGKL